MDDKETAAALAVRSYRILGRSIGKVIERLRERKGLTQEELVAEMSRGPGLVRLHSSGLSKIENGHRMPRANLLFAICQALGLEMVQFWQWEARVRQELLGELDRDPPDTPAP